MITLLVFENVVKLRRGLNFIGSDNKESGRNGGAPGSIPGSGRSSWKGEWLPTPVFLPGEFHEQRSLVGYISPWGCKELDTTERLTLFTFTYCIRVGANLEGTYKTGVLIRPREDIDTHTGQKAT